MLLLKPLRWICQRLYRLFVGRPGHEVPLARPADVGRDVFEFMASLRQHDPAPKRQRQPNPKCPTPERRPSLHEWLNELLDPEDRV